MTLPPRPRQRRTSAVSGDGDVRMEDVARAAGVSLVTVSRAINHPDKVAPDTLKAVREAIARLGYVPNLMAGSLASNRSRIIASTVPTLTNSLFADSIDGLSAALAAKGYQLLIGQTHYRPDEEARLVDAFLGRRVDGIMLTGVHHEAETRHKLRRAGIPVVEIWDLSEDPIDMAIGFSNAAIGEAVAYYLLDRGYRRFGYIGAEEDRSLKRLKAFSATVQSRGAPPVVPALMPPPSSIHNGARYLSTLLEHQPDMQAIFCSNDSLAIGALFECQRRGWAVPGRLAIMGFADLPIAAECTPTLSSVQVQQKLIGEKAGEQILGRLEGREIAQSVVDLGFRIQARAST